MTELNKQNTTNKDPLSAYIGPFSTGQIPFNRPVLGGDLEALQVRLGLQVSDAIWLLGLNTQSWYKHTTDPVRKLRRKTERDRKKHVVHRDKLVSEYDELKRKLMVCAKGVEDEICEELLRYKKEMTQLDERFEKTVPTPEMLRKAEADRDSSNVGPDKPVSESLALLVRFFDALDTYVENVSARLPSVHEFKRQLNGISDRDIAQLVGRDASAGYRWAELDALPHPTVGRIMGCLSRWLEKNTSEGIPKIEIWWNVVRREYALREVWMERSRRTPVNTKKLRHLRTIGADVSTTVNPISPSAEQRSCF